MMYFQIEFDLRQLERAEVIYFLSSYEILGLEELEDSIVAYADNRDLKDQIHKEIISRNWVNEVKFFELPAQNWNKTWESNFDPVYVDQFCQVIAEFHEPKKGFQHTIHLQPKMAFGTGHHETTFMMIQQMAKIDFAGKKVFDFGCGSGILAFLAEKMGAEHILGIDIDTQAITNAIENGEHNRCEKISWQTGVLTDVERQDFDVILANINRNVLLDVADKIGSVLKPRGLILLSGILDQDYELVKTTYKDQNFHLLEKQQKEEWWCLQFVN